MENEINKERILDPEDAKEKADKLREFIRIEVEKILREHNLIP